jgi:flagellar P-ring protein precursor FlgI
MVLVTLVAGLVLGSAASAASAESGSNAVGGGESRLLVGVGVVIGLPGTGDSVVDHAAVDASIIGVLKRAGLEPWRDQIASGRMAVVMLSADLPSDAREGAKFDVSVSAMGDARSLAGGTLLVAPLRDGDGVVHATGQGVISIDALRAAAGEVDAGANLRMAEIAGGAVIGNHDSRRNYASLGSAMAPD